MPKRDPSALALLIVAVLIMGAGLVAGLATAWYSAPGANPFAVLRHLAPPVPH